MQKISIGIDLGGSRIKAVALREEGEIIYKRVQPTNDGDDTVWKRAVAEVVLEILKELPAKNTQVGISAPGLPNSGNSAIAFMPGRLQGLENFIWSDFLGIRTYVLNDTVSALLAEARYGVAKGRKNVVMVTLGTGVGGAVLIEGKPYMGAFSKAGHIGHMVIDSDGEADIIGMPGSLEDAIGNCTIGKRTAGRFTSTSQLLESVRTGDLQSAEVWLTSVKKLAIGLATLTNILSPEMIILGGGITDAGNELFEPLEKFMAQYEWRTGGNKTIIVKAQYGDLSGAVGAACFARENLR
jgi:glucokinase